MFSSLEPGHYTLRVVATNRRPDKEFIKRNLETTDDPERCILHLINSGVSVEDNVTTVEFASQGPVQGYNCFVNKSIDAYECKCLELWVQLPLMPLLQAPVQ